jgi:hypothetical protein
MTRMTKKLLRVTLAAATGMGCLFGNDSISLVRHDFVLTEAHARIGRPLTPMSYAGVARRTTRRAVVGGAVVGGAVAGSVYGAPGCVQVVNGYGQIVYRCP